MYYPRKIPEHFLKNITETEETLPLTAREHVRQPENKFPTAILLLALLSVSKEQQ